MPILAKETTFDELNNKIVNKVTYDNTAVLKANEADRIERAGHMMKFKGKTLVHAARVDMGDVQRLYNMGYNILSPDPDEVKRALLYLQSEEKDLLTVDGKPFAKKKTRWV